MCGFLTGKEERKLFDSLHPRCKAAVGIGQCKSKIAHDKFGFCEKHFQMFKKNGSVAQVEANEKIIKTI